MDLFRDCVISFFIRHVSFASFAPKPTLSINPATHPQWTGSSGFMPKGEIWFWFPSLFALWTHKHIHVLYRRGISGQIEIHTSPHTRRTGRMGFRPQDSHEREWYPFQVPRHSEAWFLESDSHKSFVSDGSKIVINARAISQISGPHVVLPSVRNRTWLFDLSTHGKCHLSRAVNQKHALITRRNVFREGGSF